MLLVFGWWTLAQEPQDTTSGQEYDFAITRAYLETLENGHTILPTLKLSLGEHSGIHPVAQDCELHLAGTFATALGDPAPFVVEPPNICTETPPGSTVTSTKSRNARWLKLFDGENGKTCDVTGFPRIFTEHVSSGGESGGSNPNHVFEMHPALKIACQGGETLSFASFLKAPAGLRHITPQAADQCLSDRTLEVRFANNQYEFRQHGGGCGNFAIVELGALNPKWIRKVDGGHTAIARVSADGATRHSLKLYTFEGTDADTFVGGLMGQTTIPEPHILVHGVFTYDYFAMLRLLHPRGQQWQTPTSWTAVPFPLAFLVYGETETVPWGGETE
jgi:hypothetical protein